MVAGFEGRRAGGPGPGPGAPQPRVWRAGTTWEVAATAVVMRVSRSCLAGAGFRGLPAEQFRRSGMTSVFFSPFCSRLGERGGNSPATKKITGELRQQFISPEMRCSTGEWHDETNEKVLPFSEKPITGPTIHELGRFHETKDGR